jgi:hypothetical protein
MDIGFGDLGAMAPVYVLFLTSGLIIYAVSSWVGEALLNQIRESKTSVFGRSDNYKESKSRAIYVPPAQLSTIKQETRLSKSSAEYNLPSIPVRPPVRPSK